MTVYTLILLYLAVRLSTKSLDGNNTTVGGQKIMNEQATRIVVVNQAVETA